MWTTSAAAHGNSAADLLDEVDDERFALLEATLIATNDTAQRACGLQKRARLRRQRAYSRARSGAHNRATSTTGDRDDTSVDRVVAARRVGLAAALVDAEAAAALLVGQAHADGAAWCLAALLGTSPSAPCMTVYALL